MNDENKGRLQIPSCCVAIILLYCIVLYAFYKAGDSRLTWMVNFGPIYTSLTICAFLLFQLFRDLKNDVQGESIAPTLMVAQGTFFTFLGVSYILYTYDPNNGNIADLLGGLRLAFFTSLIGLFFSIAARAIIYTKRQVVRRTASYMDNKLIDERDLYVMLCEVSRKMSQLSGIDDKLRAIRDNEAELNELKYISRYLKYMSDNLETQLENTQSIRSITYDIRRNQEAANNSLENLEENISNSLGKSNDLMRANLDNIYKEMQANMANLSESVLGNVKDCFGEIRNTTEETSKILLDIKDTANNISASSETIDSHFINMKENAAQTDAKFQSIKEYLGGTMDSAKDYAEATTKAMDAAADAISKVSTINTTFAENAVNISTAVNAIDTSASNISGVLNKVCATSENVAESVEKISRTVGEYSELNEKLVNTLRDTDLISNVEKVADMEAKLSNNIQGQLKVVDAVANNLVELRDSLNNFDQQIERLNDVQKYAKTIFNNSQLFAEAFEKGAEKVNDEFGRWIQGIAQKSIDGVTSYTNSVANEMKEAQRRYQDQAVKSQEPFVEALTKSINILNTKIEKEKEEREESLFKTLGKKLTGR